MYRSGIDGIGVDAPSRSSVGLYMNSSTASSIAAALVVRGSSSTVVTAVCNVVSVSLLAAAADVSTLTFIASTVSTSVALSGVLTAATATVRGPGHGSNSVCAVCLAVPSVVCLLHAELVSVNGVSGRCAPASYTALNTSFASVA